MWHANNGFVQHADSFKVKDWQQQSLHRKALYFKLWAIVGSHVL